MDYCDYLKNKYDFLRNPKELEDFKKIVKGAKGRNLDFPAYFCYLCYGIFDDKQHDVLTNKYGFKYVEEGHPLYNISQKILLGGFKW